MSETDLAISWTRAAQFIRQLNHDLRNHLNAFELQSAFLGELVESDEVKKEVKRLRGMNAEMSAQLQRLSHAVGAITPQMMRYGARDLVEDLRKRLEVISETTLAGETEWQLSLGDESIEADPQLLLEVFTELFANAVTHNRADGALKFSAQPNRDQIDFSLHEPKSKPVEVNGTWGACPFVRVSRGHYGLGLFRVRNIVERHHGRFSARFDSAKAALVTTVEIPQCAG